MAIFRECNQIQTFIDFDRGKFGLGGGLWGLCDVAYIGASFFAEDRTRSSARRARSSAIDTTFGGHALDLRDGRPNTCSSRAALSFHVVVN